MFSEPSAPAFRIPRGVFIVVKEVLRHLLRRPVVGIAAAARNSDGKWLLVRRADTGQWALPGGTLEWGESLRECLTREMREETGIETCDIGRLVGVYSRPDRDPRLHGVTVVVECRVGPQVRAPTNPIEILETRLFAPSELPAVMAMGMHDMLAAAIQGGPEAVVE